MGVWRAENGGLYTLNEIEAKQYLLKSTKKYKIPSEEVELTKKQLESYQKEMEELKKDGKWNENN